MQNSKPKFIGNCFNCKKIGHQAHECKSKKSDSSTKSRFEGHCYNCKKYGHRAHECRSKKKSNWTSEKKEHAPRKGNSHNWNYNT